MDYNITYRQKDKGWQFIISYKDSNGKWKQKSRQGFKTKKEAKPIAEETLRDLSKNIKSLNNPFGKITFKSFSEMYLEHEKIYKQYKTIDNVISVLHKFKYLNNKELTKITNLDIQKIIDSMAKDNLNINTIRHYVKILNIIFLSAKNDYKIISELPTKNVKLPKAVPTSKKALNDLEVNSLLNDFKNTKYYLLVFLAINTGMRLGELLGLTWDNIDLNNNTITVNKQWKKSLDNIYGFGTVKSKNSARVIPVSNIVIKELLKSKNIINLDNRIFNFNSTNSISSMMGTKLKKYDITFHELRHTYATKLIANGVDFKTAAQILGHTIEQTMKTYSHVNNDMIKKAHSIIENIF